MQSLTRFSFGSFEKLISVNGTRTFSVEGTSCVRGENDTEDSNSVSLSRIHMHTQSQPPIHQALGHVVASICANEGEILIQWQNEGKRRSTSPNDVKALPLA